MIIVSRYDPAHAFEEETTIVRLMCHEGIEALFRSLSEEQRALADQLQLSGQFFSQSTFDSFGWAPTEADEKQVYWQAQLLAKDPDRLTIADTTWLDISCCLVREGPSKSWTPQEVRLKQTRFEWHGIFAYQKWGRGYQLLVPEPVAVTHC